MLERMSLLALVPLSPDAAEEVTRVHLAARAAYYGQPTEQNGAYQPMWRSRLAEPDWRLTGASAGGTLVGFSAVQVPSSTPDVVDVADSAPPYPLHLVGLYVLPGQWGLGIGSLLYGAFEAAWANSAHGRAELEVWSLNHRARGFYARRGWELDGRTRPAHAGTEYLGMVLRRT
jgi:GNAT superfamily N-acetyltransferase